MNRKSLVLFSSLLFSILSFGKEATQKILIRAVSYKGSVLDRTVVSSTPGRSTTNCAGDDRNVTCQTTTAAPTLSTHNRRIIDIVNIVEADGKRYKISCTATWVGSNCSPMTEGDEFEAQIEHKTMWVYARKGGNQGKLIKVRNRILDIRPVQSNQSLDVTASGSRSR